MNDSDDLPLYIVFLLLYINQLIKLLTACWTLSILWSVFEIQDISEIISFPQNIHWICWLSDKVLYFFRD